MGNKAKREKSSVILKNKNQNQNQGSPSGCYGSVFEAAAEEERMTSKSLRVHSATSSLLLTKISVPTSRDVHTLLAGWEPGSCRNLKKAKKKKTIDLILLNSSFPH